MLILIRLLMHWYTVADIDTGADTDTETDTDTDTDADTDTVASFNLQYTYALNSDFANGCLQFIGYAYYKL